MICKPLESKEKQRVAGSVFALRVLGEKGVRRLRLTVDCSCNSNNPNTDFQNSPKKLPQKLTLSSRTDQLAEIRAQVARLAGPGKPAAYGTLGDLVALVRDGGRP